MGSADELTAASTVKLNNLGVDDDDCALLGELARTAELEGLVKLDLSYNQIGGVGLSALTVGLTHGALRSLKFLILSRNDLGDAGVISLAGALSAGAMPQLTQLEIEGVNIGDAGLCALAAAVASGATEALLGLVVGKAHLQHVSLAQACGTRGVTLV